MEANVFHRTVDFPEEYAEGFHIALDGGNVVTVSGIGWSLLI